MVFVCLFSIPGFSTVMILIPQQRSNEKHQTGMQMAVFPKKMGFCAIEASQTAWQESGAGEVLGKRRSGRGSSAAGSVPGGRAAVPGLCPPLEVCAICLSGALFTSFTRNHGIATTCRVFLITLHCLCGNTQVLSTAVPRACVCLVAVAWPLVPSPSADGAAGWLLLPRCHPARLDPLSSGQAFLSQTYRAVP